MLFYIKTDKKKSTLSYSQYTHKSHILQNTSPGTHTTTLPQDTHTPYYRTTGLPHPRLHPSTGHLHRTHTHPTTGLQDHHTLNYCRTTTPSTTGLLGQTYPQEQHTYLNTPLYSCFRSSKLVTTPYLWSLTPVHCDAYKLNNCADVGLPSTTFSYTSATSSFRQDGRVFRGHPDLVVLNGGNGVFGP